MKKHCAFDSPQLLKKSHTNLGGIQTRIAEWVIHHRLIRRVFLFGSRVRNAHREDSDLDIAIELIYPNIDTALAHWSFESDAWKDELQKFVPWRVDLQLLCPQGTAAIVSGVERSSILIYERRA